MNRKEMFKAIDRGGRGFCFRNVCSGNKKKRLTSGNKGVSFFSDLMVQTCFEYDMLILQSFIMVIFFGQSVIFKLYRFN